MQADVARLRQELDQREQRIALSAADQVVVVDQQEQLRAGPLRGTSPAVGSTWMPASRSRSAATDVVDRVGRG